MPSQNDPLRTWGVQCNPYPLTDLREIGIMGAILPLQAPLKADLEVVYFGAPGDP